MKISVVFKLQDEISYYSLEIVKDSYYALGIVKDSSQILQIELNLPGKNAEFEAQSKDNLNRKLY